MRQSLVVRLTLLCAGALAFGALESILKGNGGGLRDGIGNLSAPWILVPLFAGATAYPQRLRRAAVIGLLVQLVALTAFYLTNAFVLDLGSHSLWHDIGLTLNARNIWLRAGLLSGPVMGTLGALAARRGRITVLGAAAAIAVLEPLLVYLAYVATNGDFAGGDGRWNAVYAAEVAVGLCAAICVHVAARHRAGPQP